MPVNYSEKRNFFRMNLECKAEYVIDGSENQKIGKVSNLSGDGLSLITDEEVAPGTEIHVSILPENPVTPPLEVLMEVLRCEAHDNDSFLLAGNITKQ